MNATLDLSDLIRLGQAPLDQMAEASSHLDPSDEAARAAFARLIAVVEAVLKQTWQAAALLAKRAADCEEAAGVWRGMSDYANQVIIILSALKDRHPQCGTPELHD